jgi:dissimilatory sulfite reductase (desulfoviridin) alpha/beta subunit
MKPEENMWYPGLDYKGREGDYAQTIDDLALSQVIELVQKRANEDYVWIMANGMSGDSPVRMEKMLVWVTNERNIKQCVEHIWSEGMHHERTVDSVCRELGEITHKLGRPSD